MVSISDLIFLKGLHLAESSGRLPKPRAGQILRRRRRQRQRRRRQRQRRRRRRMHRKTRRWTTLEQLNLILPHSLTQI